MKKIKKNTLGSSIAVALTAGMLLTTSPAFATTNGYLGAPTITPYTGVAPTSPTFTASLTPNTNPLAGPTGYPALSINVTPNSSYGNTFVPTGPGYTSVSAAPPLADYFYNPAGLNLTQVAPPLISNYSVTDSQGAFSGQLISNVFAVGNNPTMAGAIQGELVYTYQFDVTSANPNYTGAQQASISFFNDPNGFIYNLGDGININGFNFTGAPNYITLGTNICPTCTYSTLVGLSGLTGLDPVNGSVASVQYQETATVGVGEITPQIFVASNSFNFTEGTMSVEAFGGSSGTLNVYVPNSPEPGTLVLFGTALGFTGFMVIRKRRNQITA